MKKTMLFCLTAALLLTSLCSCQASEKNLSGQITEATTEITFEQDTAPHKETVSEQPKNSAEVTEEAVTETVAETVAETGSTVEVKPNQNEEVSYVTVRSGKGSICPRSYFEAGRGYEEDEDGCSEYFADGEGIWFLFNDPTADYNTLPTLTLDGNVNVLLPADTALNGGDAYLYTLNCEPYAPAERVKLSQLYDLPAGEYIVVFKTVFRKNYTEHGEEHDVYAYSDQAFKLFVKDNSHRFTYSDMKVHCGDQTISPMRFFCSGSEAVDFGNGRDLIVEADGSAFDRGFGWPEEDHAVLPTLTLTDALSLELPPYITAGNKAMLYDLSVEPLTNDVPISFEELQAWAPGEYIAVIYERYRYSQEAEEGSAGLFTEEDTRYGNIFSHDEVKGAVRYSADITFYSAFKLIIPAK